MIAKHLILFNSQTENLFDKSLYKIEKRISYVKKNIFIIFIFIFLESYFSFIRNSYGNLFDVNILDGNILLDLHILFEQYFREVSSRMRIQNT